MQENPDPPVTEEPNDETGKRVVVTPSGRMIKEDIPPDTNVLVDPEDLPVTYDNALSSPGGEIDPALLEQVYAMAKQREMERRSAIIKHFRPKSNTTKKHQTKEKKVSRSKLQKKSRKKNRKT